MAMNIDSAHATGWLLPPEDEKKVETAIDAARAAQARDDSL